MSGVNVPFPPDQANALECKTDPPRLKLPLQVVKLEPALASGLETRLNSTVSVSSPVQGVSKSPVSVNTTTPDSPIPGVYVGVNVPCPDVILPVPSCDHRMFSTFAVVASLAKV